MLDIGVMQIETWEDTEPTGLSLAASRWLDGSAVISTGQVPHLSAVHLTKDQRRELVEFLKEGLE